jgi:hypothetical protein
VDRARAENNVDATIVAALSLLSAEQCFAPEGQPVLKGFDPGQNTEEFSTILGELSAKGTSVDGSPIKESAA